MHRLENNSTLKKKLQRLTREMEFARRNMPMYLLLTNREKEVIQLLSSGHNNPSIAQELFISRYTVEQHRKNIHRKLQVHNLNEVFTFAYAYDLVERIY